MSATSESEQHRLEVASSTGTYPVTVGAGLVAGLLARDDRRSFAVVDERFAELDGLAADRTILVPVREAEKTLARVEAICVELRTRGARRGDHLVGIGGGIVQDVATLAAQLFMRGLPWTYVPTTLLGMVDSCIGGKSSINAPPFKNLIGSFHPPDEVLVDVDFLDTLPDEDMAGGLAEAMKITYCRGPEAFATYQQLTAGFPATATDLVAHSLRSKQWFIEVDEFDQAERRLLNFGHTFGHALEAATDFAVGHGICVALGVLAASEFADATGSGARDERLEAEAISLASRALSAARRLEGFDAVTFERAFLSDKKHGADGLHLIVPQAGGGVAEVTVPDDPGSREAARSAVLGAIARLA